LFKYLFNMVLVLLLACTGLWAMGHKQRQDIMPTEISGAPDNPREKLTGQRVMQRFDFEERSIHYLPQPMYWTKVTDKGNLRTYMLEAGGFPHYATGKLDTRYHHSGEYSFQLISDGGSVGFEYDKRRIRVKPGSDFQITGFVHLEKAEHCRAQIICALTDRLGRIIPGSLLASGLKGQIDQDQNGWARLEVYVPGNFSDARFITVSLWLLQEQQWNREERAEYQVFQKDVQAEAWFDDVTIFQLPRVVLQTDRAENVFEGKETARLLVEVEGVGSLDYHVHLTVYDLNDKLIQEKAWVLSGVEGQRNIEKTDLKGLPAGIYRATLKIYSSNTLVATRKLTFAQTAELETETAGSGQGFGVILMDEHRSDWQTTTNLTRMLNAKLLKLPVWQRKSGTGGAMSAQKSFDQKLINLQSEKIQVVATFNEVPEELAVKMDIGRRGLLDVLSREVQFWRPQVAFVLAQYARQVPYWQIGGDFEKNRVWDPRIRGVLDTLRKEFDKLVKDTVLTVPLNSIFEVDREQVGTDYVALGIPNAIVPEEIPDYLEDCRKRGLTKIWATIEPLEYEKYDREQVLIDFAKRIAYAKKGRAQGIFIDHPWRERQYNARSLIEPTELYLVFRTLADQLGLTRFAGQFYLRPGIPALIFDRDGQGCLFAWNENYDPQNKETPTQIQLYLGEAPVMLDLFGNRTNLPLHNGLAKLQLNQWPVLLSRIDSRLAILRASLELSPNVIDADISRRYLHLKFVNPFASTISGHLRFLLDEHRHRNWIIDPTSLNFVLSPGQQFEREITMKFPSNELGGEKKLDTLFTIDADRSYTIRAAVPFQIQLSGVDVNIFTRRISQSDLLIQQVVTNDSEQEISLNSFVDLPDQDRMERAIARLQPGATVTKYYVIREAEKWTGRYIRIGLYDPKGTQRINYHIEIN